MTTVEELYGVWHLLSVYGENAAGERNYYFGTDNRGRLIYLPDGYMSVFVMKNGRPALSGGIAEGTSEEIQAAFEAFDAYTGTYTVDTDAGLITHHVDMARAPAYVGSEQVRRFSLDDGILSISTPPVEIGGQTWVFYLKWRK